MPSSNGGGTARLASVPIDDIVIAVADEARINRSVN
jgi:hypothetical protein